MKFQKYWKETVIAQTLFCSIVVDRRNSELLERREVLPRLSNEQPEQKTKKIYKNYLKSK